MQRPIITLTTDFGLSDHYVGTMKGVILSRCPEVQLVDLSHEVERFSVQAGAYTMDQAVAFFPRGTVHVGVIDPGVGTERKPILAEAVGQLFIAPDNGLLSLVLARDSKAIVREIANRDLWLPSPSATFHGRDVFAPAAASLAAGTVEPRNAGPLVEHPILLPRLKPQQIKSKLWEGIALSIDHFGNVITNFRASAFASGPKFSLLAGAAEVSEFGVTFGSAPKNLCFAYVGSSGFLEIGINQQNAAERLKIHPGDTVRLKLE